VKREAVLRALREVFGPRGVLWEAHHLLLYEYDASIDKGRPDFVVFPTSTEQVVAAVRIANRYGLPIVVRGAGTGLSGGAAADQGGLMIVTTRMRRILEIDPVNLRAVVQPGVVNRPSPRPPPPTASTTPRTPPARRHAPSAATSLRTPEGPTAWPTG